MISKKYAHLYGPLVERIRAEEYPKYKRDKDRLKAVKNKLHMVYGAFLGGDGWHKQAEAIISSGDIDNAALMRLHASTSERMQAISEFYEFVFGAVGHVQSILDIGCGFNPFALACMPASIKRYHAYDIDTRIISLINAYFDLLELPRLAACADIIAHTPQDAVDAAFLFKLMPVIEAQAPGRAFRLLREINAGYIVVTYPAKSLGGRDKGMALNYARAFEQGIAGAFDIIAQKIIGSELVYIIAASVALSNR